MSPDFNAAELELLADEADDMLLAGLAHRFDATQKRAVEEGGPALVGHALAATVVQAALREFAPLARQIAGRATFRRRRERAIVGDPMAGQLDLGRIALADPDVGAWPIIRPTRSHDTPENAVLSATLGMVNSWGSRSARRFSGWTGAGLFSKCAGEAGRLRRFLLSALGDLPLESQGAAQLLPLARERLALRKAPPADYARALQLAEVLLSLADPRRQLARTPNRDWVLDAMVGGLNEAGLQNTAFELWVASRLAKRCRSLGFEISYPHRSGTPLAVGTSGKRRVEIWWQSARPIVAWPSAQDHERRLDDGQWSPLSLRPDLVLISRRNSSARMLCIECKNKLVQAPPSSDLAQAFGYLAHYGALQRCALAYRGIEESAVFRRASTAQEAIAIDVPLRPDGQIGERLFELLP